MLFRQGINLSHETVPIWCATFGLDLAEALRSHKPRLGRVWHLGEMRMVVGGTVHWL